MITMLFILPTKKTHYTNYFPVPQLICDVICIWKWKYSNSSYLYIKL